jgi:tetratricopeptide (TPR) repeat protein
MYSLLKKYYPNSKITARATARLGKAFGDIAFYDRAAEELERYATKYAGEKDAHDAMSDAVFYRKGIGDDAKAIEDTKYFVRTFGTKKPAEAANAAFSLTSVFEKQGDKDAVIKHLREYIRVHGAKGGADKLVIAHAKIGKILFEQSCPVKAVNGSCVKVSRERAVVQKNKTKRKKGKEVYVAPQQCGPESKIKLTVVDRDPGKLKKAMQEFSLAAREFAKVNEKDDGALGARYWYALGKFAEADVEFEKYLDIKFPTNLNFGDGSPEKKAMAEKAMKRFNDWLESDPEPTGTPDV